MRFAAKIWLLAAGLAAATPAAAKTPEPEPSACALRSNFDFLRDLAFTSASTRLPAKSASLARLKRAVLAEGRDVRAVSYDPATGRIECAMTLRLALPLSSRAYFGGLAELTAPVRYWAEPDSAGQGYAIVTNGLAPLSARLVEAAARFPESPSFASPEVPAPLPAKVDPAPAPATPEPARAAFRPGFDCARAASPTEEMICASEALSEADRIMSTRYFAVRAGLAGSSRQRLLDSQRRFLSLRDRCTSEACLVGLYMARKAELDRFGQKPKPVARRAGR